MQGGDLFLKKNSTGNFVGSEGAKSISESLTINTSLTELQLEGDEKIYNDENEK